MAKLEIRNLSFKYPDADRPTLDNLNLSIEDGEFVCILGASGCGKSTLLSILEGLQQATEGGFYINDKEITGPGPDRGVVFQHYSLFPWMSAKGNIVFGIRQAQKGIKKKEAEQIAQSYLDKVGLSGNEKMLPARLSGGMQQRVAIARALAMDSDILLLDEPFGAVDTKNRRTLQRLVSSLHEEEHKTFIFVTHDVEEAILLADRVVFMVPGKIYQVIDVNIPKPRDYEELRNDPEFTRIRKLLIDLFYENYSDYSLDSTEGRL